MKHLIITGDDFGRSHQVNEAIEQAHNAGFLTQASLMVNEPCAEEAARIAQRHSGLCVGLHLTLCAGRASSTSVLSDANGDFPPSPARNGWRYALRSALSDPLQREIRAQFERFRSLGLPPSYWDGHTHLHLHPTIFRLTLPVAVEHGFRAMRLVREPGPWSLIPSIFGLLSCAAMPALQRHAITFTDRTFGLRQTGRMTTETASRILANLPDGLSEFYFHPGAEPGGIDYAALCALIETKGITLRTSLPPAAGQ